MVKALSMSTGEPDLNPHRNTLDVVTWAYNLSIPVMRWEVKTE